MQLTNQTKVLLIATLGLFLLYLLYSQNKNYNGQSEDGNEGFDAPALPQNMEQSAQESKDAGMKAPINPDEMVNYIPTKDYSVPEVDDSAFLKRKFSGRNRAAKGTYKRSSYISDGRGNLGPSSWDDYFDANNNVIGDSQTGDNDKFLPVDESKGGLAIFKSAGGASCGSNQNCEPEQMFDADALLPQEVNDDWFEVQPEPISVKNRHLINITKPIGINTIGTTKKIASWDIRGVPACPKYVVSPWLNSAIEPDTNLKPLF